MWFFFKYYFSQFFNLSKKIFLVLITFVAVISLFVYFISKDKPKQTVNLIEKNRQEIYQTINNPELKKTKEGKIFIAFYRAMYCGFIGEACTDNPKDGDKNFNHSIFGFLTKLIVLPYANPPASGVYWAYSGLQNAGFVPKTYAAEGIGMAAIRPFANLWKVFRDISYMLLVLVLIAIGFMIMFRAKLNPQTVISVENSLPKIVVSLILITFSFPIAGFLIDLMYVLILIIIAVLSNHGNFFNINEFQNQYLNADFGAVWNGVFANNFFGSTFGLANAIVGILPYIINQILRVALAIVGVALSIKLFFTESFQHFLDSIGDISDAPILGEAVGVLEFLSKPFFFVVFVFLGIILGYGSLSIIIFILTIGTFILTIFRIFFLLLNSYIKILLMIIFSPLFMLFEAIPSGKSAFSYWFKQLLAEIISFPLVVCFLVVSYIILNVVPSSGNIWQPPFLVSLNPNLFTVLIAMGLLFMIPDLVKLVKQMLGVKDMPINIGLGTFFAGAGAFTGGLMSVSQKVPSITSLLPGTIRDSLRQRAPSFIKDVLIPPSAQELQKMSAQTAGTAAGRAISAQIETLTKLLKEAKEENK